VLIVHWIKEYIDIRSTDNANGQTLQKLNEMDRVLDNLEEYADALASLMTEKFEVLACV
jgi:hypothetical protein